jgi:hypothetical protein
MKSILICGLLIIVAMVTFCFAQTWDRTPFTEDVDSCKASCERVYARDQVKLDQCKMRCLSRNLDKHKPFGK